MTIDNSYIFTLHTIELPYEWRLFLIPLNAKRCSSNMTVQTGEAIEKLLIKHVPSMSCLDTI